MSWASADGSLSILALILSQAILAQWLPAVLLGQFCYNVLLGPIVVQQWLPIVEVDFCGQTDRQTWPALEVFFAYART